MADKDQVSNTFYTISHPDFMAFQQFCDTEPMCKDWTYGPDMGGFITVHVPNWTAEVCDFYAKISEFVVFPEAKKYTPTWFEGMNPVIAKRFDLTES